MRKRVISFVLVAATLCGSFVMVRQTGQGQEAPKPDSNTVLEYVPLPAPKGAGGGYGGGYVTVYSESSPSSPELDAAIQQYLGATDAAGKSVARDKAMEAL